VKPPKRLKPPSIRVLYAPKEGSAEEEWEDAAYYDPRTGYCAVADGAGSSYRASRWSSALVESWALAPPELAPDLVDFRDWVRRVGDAFQTTSEAVSGTSWYTADASRRGSFATFVGLRLIPGPPFRMQAVSVGDACLFQCRDGRLVAEGTSITDPDSFDSTPHLLGSSPYQDSYGAEQARYFDAPLDVGDLVLLTTDALGAAMLRLDRAGHPVWTEFAERGPTGFGRIVERLRATEVMENDDVTMLRVRTGAMAS